MSDTEIKIAHRPAANYASHSATGALLVGPSGDGMFHLTFFSDRLYVKTETGSLVESGRYATSVREDDLESFREDKVSISVTPAILKDLSEALARRVAELDNERAVG